MQLKYSNYVAFSHDHDFAVNNSGIVLFKFLIFFIIPFMETSLGIWYIVSKQIQRYKNFYQMYDIYLIVWRSELYDKT